MMSTVPSTPASYGGTTPLRILNKGPEYFRNSKRSGNENRRKTATERLEADKFKYVKSEEVRQRRFTLELRTSSPPNNDSTGTQSMGTASTGSPINMEEDDDVLTGNDVTGDFTTEGIMKAMANFTKYNEVKPQNATPVTSRRRQNRLSTEDATVSKSATKLNNTDAEVLHSMTATRRLQRMKNKAIRNSEIEKNNRNLNDNVTPPSPLLTRLREKLHSSNSQSSNGSTGNAFTPSPTIASTADEGSKTQPIIMKSPESESKSFIPKNSQQTKSVFASNALNTYISKAKEGIKNVLNTEQRKERQPRSANSSNGRRYRSASAGPNVNKTTQYNPRLTSSAEMGHNLLSVTKSEASNATNPLLSPRSQLKHVRQNLKKVNIGSERIHTRRHTNSETSVPAEYKSGLKKVSGTTFTVNPALQKKSQNFQNDASNTAENAMDTKDTRVEAKPPMLPRSKKEKENIRRTASSDSQPHSIESLKKRTSSVSSKEGTETEESGSNLYKNEPKRSNSNRVKRRSWDILHASDNTQYTKTSGEENTPPPSIEMDTNASHSHSRQRRPRSYTSDQRKSNLSSRMSLPEDSMQPFKDANSQLFQKTGSRKSVAEAIEEIINPVLENTKNNDIKRNSAGSPDIASMDGNTLVENRESFFGNLSTATNYGNGSNAGTKNSSVADNINFVLGGAIEGSLGSGNSDNSDKRQDRSKTSSNSRPKKEEFSASYSNKPKSVTQKSREKESSSMELLDSSGHYTRSSTKTPSYFDGPNNTTHLRHVPMRQHSAPIGFANPQDHPVAPTTKSDDGNLSNSPMLAPKSRREVVPDYRKQHHPKNDDTMKSHNTSSSSGNANKPFTALTANDLKPRSNKNNSTIVPQSTPIKPTFAFPGQPLSQTRHNPKRPTTTPISPTLSPNKQAARMTPPQTPTRSCSSTPYSSLKRTPTSSRSSSLKRNRHRSKSDVLSHQHELDRFFSTMGMEEYMNLAHHSSMNDTLYSNHLSSESDFSFAGASAYVRDSPDEAMDVDPVTTALIRGPQSVSIIEKNARVMRWLMTCQKNRKSSTTTKLSRENLSQSPPVSPSTREPIKPSHKLLSTYPPASAPISNGYHSGSHQAPLLRPSSQPNTSSYPSSPPPIPPRTYQRQHAVYQPPHNDAILVGAPKESNV
uniref:putative uncharacterized protein DDB_G0287457 n=1 Tax=Styela clava TaxID=7725 RepID=UPI001939621E|nr:putative uncharacterized protein DDB_G0287457 [Styela clava]